MTTVSPFETGSVRGRLLEHLLHGKDDPSSVLNNPVEIALYEKPA